MKSKNIFVGTRLNVCRLYQLIDLIQYLYYNEYELISFKDADDIIFICFAINVSYLSAWF